MQTGFWHFLYIYYYIFLGNRQSESSEFDKKMFSCNGINNHVAYRLVQFAQDVSAGWSRARKRRSRSVSCSVALMFLIMGKEEMHSVIQQKRHLHYRDWWSYAWNHFWCLAGTVIKIALRLYVFQLPRLLHTSTSKPELVRSSSRTPLTWNASYFFKRQLCLLPSCAGFRGDETRRGRGNAGKSSVAAESVRWLWVALARCMKVGNLHSGALLLDIAHTESFFGPLPLNVMMFIHQIGDGWNDVDVSSLVTSKTDCFLSSI